MSARTCDQLGACQSRPTPCPGCTQPNRRAQPRACLADHCHQGRTACPCPQACELPALQATPATRTSCAAFLAVVAALCACSLVILAASA